jgi:hypothetical protein
VIRLAAFQSRSLLCRASRLTVTILIVTIHVWHLAAKFLTTSSLKAAGKINAGGSGDGAADPHERLASASIAS